MTIKLSILVDNLKENYILYILQKMSFLRLNLTLLSVFLCQSLFSQVIEETAPLNIVRTGTVLRVVVIDKETSSPLHGADVSLSCGKDTLKAASGRNGVAFFTHIPFRESRDTVVLSVSFLGYKDLETAFLLKKESYMKAMMEADPQQLNEIVVRDKSVLMIIRGDTTIYNASAIATMRGDRLADILGRLPGLSVSGGIIYIKGEPVSKILLNGSSIFGSDIGVALEMIRADDIRNVKVYDQYDQDRLLEADTLDRKERVLDVMTRRQTGVMQETKLGASAGVFTEKGLDGKTDAAAMLSGSYRRFTDDGMSVEGSVGLDRNYSDAEPSSSPKDNAVASMILGRKRKFKDSFFHSLNIGYDGSRFQDYEFREYSPSSSFAERSSESSGSRSDRRLGVSYTGRSGFAIGKNNTLHVSFAAGYGHNVSTDIDGMSVITDNRRVFSSITDEKRDRRYSLSASLAFNRHFGKPGRVLEISADYGHAWLSGHEERVDTSSADYMRQWMDGKTRRSSGDLSFDAGYCEPLCGENLRLSAGYGLYGKFYDGNRIADDFLCGVTDTLNTYDYRQNNLENRFRAGVLFRNRKKNMTLDASLVYVLASQTRTEKFPYSSGYLRSYGHVAPRVVFSWSTPVFSVNLNYNEFQLIPSADQTREVLDNSSPLFLRAGNSSLKQSISRNVFLGLSAFWSSCSMNMNLTFTNTSDAFASRTVYFIEDTLLPEYGYTAAAGSQLTVPVNIDGTGSLIAGMSFSSYINPINTMLVIGPGYNYSVMPFMTGEVCHDTEMHAFNINLQFETVVAKSVDFGASIAPSFGRNLLDGFLIYGFFGLDLTGNAKANFLKHCWLRSDVTYSFMKTDIESFGYDRLIWNAGISYKFGKNDAFEVGLDCYDILDRSNTWSILSRNDYIGTSWSAILGRSIILSFRCSF